MSLGVRVTELQPDIAHPLHLIFLGFLEVNVEKVALTFLPQGGQFRRVARDLIAESGFDVHKIPSAGGKVRAGRFEIGGDSLHLGGNVGELRFRVLLDFRDLCGDFLSCSGNLFRIGFPGKLARKLFLSFLVFQTQFLGECPGVG